MSSRLERLAAQSPAATAAPAPSLDADDFSAQAPEAEQAPAPPDPGQYAQAVADGVAQAAQGIAEQVAAAIPQPQYAPTNRNGRRPPVRVSVPRDPLDAFFPHGNSKRMEVHRLVADTDGRVKESQVGHFPSADLAGYPSLSEFVRQRVANKLRRWGDYICKAFDASGNIVGVVPVTLEAPPDAQMTGSAVGGAGAADAHGGDPIYGAVADFLRVMTQGGGNGSQANNPALAALVQRFQGGGGGPLDVGSVLQLVQLAQSKQGAVDGPMAQALAAVLDRLKDAGRNVQPTQTADVPGAIRQALQDHDRIWEVRLSALKADLAPKAPPPDPMAGMAAMLTAMGTIMAATKGPDIAALLTAIRPEPVPPPPPPLAQPDVVDTMVRFAKAREALEPRQEQPDVLEQVQKVVAVAGALKTMAGGDASGGNWAGVFGQLLKGGSDMIKEGSKALDKRVELEKAAAERAKMQTVATVVQAKAAAGAPVAEIARAGADAAAAVQQATATTPASEPAPTAAAMATPTASKMDVFAAVQTLGASTTDTERVRNTLALARTVEGAMPEAKAGIRDTFARAASGDRSAINDLRDLLTQAVAEAGLAQAAADATLAAFEKHWDTLVARGVFGRPANGAAVAPTPAAPATANGSTQQVAA